MTPRPPQTMIPTIRKKRADFMSRVPATGFAPFGPRPVSATPTVRTTANANQTSELMGAT